MSYHLTLLLQAVSSALIRVIFAGAMMFVSSSARRKPFMAANEGRRHLRESLSSVTSPATNVVENFTLLSSGTSTLEAPSTPEASERPSTSPTTNTVVMVTAVVTLASVVTALCVIWTIEHYYICWRGHLLQDDRSDVSMKTNLMAEIADRYWMNVEPYIKSTLLFTEEASSTAVFCTITEYDLFAYKFRTEDGICNVDPSATRVRDGQRYSQNPFQTVKELEHIFEMLTAFLRKRPTAVDKTAQSWSRLRQLMTKLHCKRAVRAPPQFQTQSSFARSLCRVACRLALAWSDDYRYVINDVIKFLEGDCDSFLSQTEDDRSLATRILAAVPYVHSLQLVGGHFRLKVADDNNAHAEDTDGKLMAGQRFFDVQVRRRVRSIDERLSAIRTAADAEILTSMTAQTFANVVDSYRELRDICTAVGIVRSGPDYPTVLSSDRQIQISPLDCVVLVRHLIRLTFGVVSHVRRLQRPTAADYEARFRRFVCGFHDYVLLLEQISVVGVGARGFGGRAAVYTRCAGNIVACVSALTGDVTREPADADHTKAVLEMVERSLARHFVWLTSRRRAAFDVGGSATVQASTSRRPHKSMPTTTTVAEIATVASRSKRPPVTFDLPSSITASDLSIYATGLSKSPVSSTADDSPFTSSESAAAGSWPVGGEVFPILGDDGVWETAL